jgi:hypothetical protein
MKVDKLIDEDRLLEEQFIMNQRLLYRHYNKKKRRVNNRN